MKKSISIQGQAGRRQLLAALGSLAVLSFLFGRFGGVGRIRRRSLAQAAGCGPARGKTATAAGNTATAARKTATAARRTARMLTQDGRLVEVDLSAARPLRKVSKEELRDWIKPTKL